MIQTDKVTKKGRKKEGTNNKNKGIYEEVNKGVNQGIIEGTSKGTVTNDRTYDEMNKQRKERKTK